MVVRSVGGKGRSCAWVVSSPCRPRERESRAPSGSEASPAPHRARAPEAGRSAGRRRSDPKQHSPNHRAPKTPPQLAAGLSVPSAARGRRDRHREQGGPSFHADIKGSRISPGLPVTATNGAGRCSVPEGNYIGRSVTNNFCCLHNFSLSQEKRRKIFFF